MGYGSYRATDWAKLKDSRGISSSSGANNIFKSCTMDDKFNPKFIHMRESCDSEDSPESTPIIIGFDVTGSMGYLAEEIAKNALNKTVLNIYDKNPVTNPHIMCAAIGDVIDKAPLQVTQFEADIRIVEQLLDLWLEGRGGDMPESYNLIWYFADKHTRTDAYDKRNKKGFLFTIGDAPTHPSLESSDIEEIFNDKEKKLTNKELLKAVSEKYEVFHIITGKSPDMRLWCDILPGRVASLPAKHINCMSELIISIMQITNGLSVEEAVAQWPEAIQSVLARALASIDPHVNDQKSFFDKIFRR